MHVFYSYNLHVFDFVGFQIFAGNSKKIFAIVTQIQNLFSYLVNEFYWFKWARLVTEEDLATLLLLKKILTV
jgi:hypothetical protein